MFSLQEQRPTFGAPRMYHLHTDLSASSPRRSAFSGLLLFIHVSYSPPAIGNKPQLLLFSSSSTQRPPTCRIIQRSHTTIPCHCSLSRAASSRSYCGCNLGADTGGFYTRTDPGRLGVAPHWLVSAGPLSCGTSLGLPWIWSRRGPSGKDPQVRSRLNIPPPM